MAQTIRYHLDEQVSKALADALRRRGIDVTRTPEVGLREAPDQDQLTFALNEGRVLVTHDRDFLALHAAGAKHAGIVFCHQDARTIGEMLTDLVLLWEIYDADELAGRLEFI
jgi:predicted nuclease of predicted toxin-antitoxin system